MKAIVHIGMGKAGSTVLQDALTGSVEELERCRLCYPVSPDGSNNHELLLVRATNPDSWPRHLHSLGDVSDLRDWSAELCRSIVDAKKKASVEGVVLSGEHFLEKMPPSWLKNELDRIGLSDCQIVCYVRSPVGYYVSALQQKVKASFNISKPQPPPYKQTLSRWLTAFGEEKVNVRLYDKDHLASGDVLHDFAGALLSKYGVDPSQLKRRKRSNESMSGEAVTILRRYREDFHPCNDNRHARDSNRLLNSLVGIDRRIGAPKPKPTLKVKAMIEQLAYEDLLWLEEKFGIRFPDFGYRENSELKWQGCEGFESIYDVLQICRSTQIEICDLLAESTWVKEASDRYHWVCGLRRELESRGV